jgi:hypothetical protein
MSPLELLLAEYIRKAFGLILPRRFYYAEYVRNVWVSCVSSFGMTVLLTDGLQPSTSLPRCDTSGSDVRSLCLMCRQL